MARLPARPYTPAMHRSNLHWESYQDIRSEAEAASASRFCLFSLSTLEVARSPGTMDIALVEQQYSDVWRWAVIGADGFITDSGSEPTRAFARTAVELALRLEGAFAAPSSNA